jgi:hypothetical protein
MYWSCPEAFGTVALGDHHHDGLEKHRMRSDPQTPPSVTGSIDDEFCLGLGVCCQTNDLVVLTLVMLIATRLEHRVFFSDAYDTGAEDGITVPTGALRLS